MLDELGEVGQGAGQAIDLIVVLATGECCQLFQVVSEPGCVFRKQHPSIFKSCSLIVETHNLIIAGSRGVLLDVEHVVMLEFLDQLRPRSLVFHQDGIRAVISASTR